MEKFKKFEIQQREIIKGGSVGGGNISTHWYGIDGTKGTDVYNTYSGELFYSL